MKGHCVSPFLLWFSSACAGAMSPSQPSPGQPVTLPHGDLGPPAWTISQTETALQEEAHKILDDGYRQIWTVYYVTDRQGAEILAEWFERRSKGAVGIGSTDPGQTDVRGVWTPGIGSVHIVERQWWTVEITSPPGRVTPAALAAWLQALQSVPPDSRWTLGPSTLLLPLTNMEQGP